MAENPLVSKLTSYMDLTAEEVTEIERWCSRPSQIEARRTLIREGSPTDLTCLMLSGWAYRYKGLRNGKRQIVGFLLPGDMCDLHGFLLRSADHGIAMVDDTVVALIPRQDMVDAFQRQPRLLDALWWSSLIDLGIAREWLLNVGQRDGISRVAHLICELWERACRAGQITDGSLILPLTQDQLGEAVGMTSVHVNRMLMRLRESGFLKKVGQRITINDLAGLKALASFDPTYLQLKR